jgi:hypothetical protein
MEVSRDAGHAARGPADRFTGDVWLWPRIGWHGAAPAAFMVHLAVSDGPTEWAGPVADDEYQG